MSMDHNYHHNGVVGGGGGGGDAVNCITVQKNVTFHLVDGNNGNNTAYFSYPTLPNSKSTFRLCGCFWSFKYFFEQSNAGSNNAPSSATQTQSHHHHHHNHHSGTNIESDACQIYIYLTRAHDNSDVEFQLYCDSGSKANFGGWTLAQMKWVSVKVSFVNPETKQVVSHKKIEGETRCGKLLCQCKQSKVCLRKSNFCSADFLQSYYVINKCTKPRYGMSATYYSSLDAFVSVTFFPQNPKSVQAANTNSVYDLYWKSQQEASKRIFHAKIGTDFKLEAAGGKEFPCHKCILAGHSEVFRIMFTAEVKRHEKLSLPTKLVMKNMSVVGVDQFLKYLYYGDTSFAQLPASIALELVKAAEKYKITHLKRTGMEVLVSKPPDDFDCGTALNMYLFAGKNISLMSQYSTLRRIAVEALSKNYAELVKSEDFVKLFVEKKESAQEILIKIHTKTRV